MTELTRQYFLLNGVVQGVGFRPYVYNLALSLGLSGFVCNCARGVEIEVEGNAAKVAEFAAKLPLNAPKLAKIDSIKTEPLTPQNSSGFVIRDSEKGEVKTMISPDMGICDDCLADIRRLGDRRYRYAFTNCTNCGPRFTIIQKLPYDRQNTSMKGFELCAPCRDEYNDPLNRRFHAQPNACPDCGPQLAFYDKDAALQPGDPLFLAQNALREGKIIAVKSIGGYHLVCDALNQNAVALLRRRKYRYGKAFAVMLPDLASARDFCDVSAAEAALLTDQRRPIVLLDKKAGGATVAPDVAPDNRRLGVMLPYTPLHYLLMEGWRALVMTSANLSDEPIAFSDDDAFSRLYPLVDGFLSHNRPIVRRCDDSVMQVVCDKPAFIRRSRGYAPQPLDLPFTFEGEIFAAGPEQKNTFCLTRGSRAFVSQHIGDLENSATMDGYLRELRFFEDVFELDPTYAVYDLHPEYLATKYVKEELHLPSLGVQHHQAHLASVLAEHNIKGRAIGFIFDGTGYGTDGHIWGGEVLLGDLTSFERLAHLDYLPLPGGAQAVKQPWRMAMAYLAKTCGASQVEALAPKGLLEGGWQLLWQAAQQGVNSPLTSSMGRLFDGVAALCGICRKADYEGQAAVELEQAVTPTDGSYAFSLEQDKAAGGTIVNWRPVIEDLLADLRRNVPTGVCAYRFHEAVVSLVVDLSVKLRQQYGSDQVVLSGGCWQNVYLLQRTLEALQKQGFNVAFNQQLPVNDGCIAYGQAAIAAAILQQKRERGED